MGAFKQKQLSDYTDLLGKDSTYYSEIIAFADKNNLKLVPVAEAFEVASGLRELTSASVNASLKHKTPEAKAEQRDILKDNYIRNTSSLKFEQDGPIYAIGDLKYNKISEDLAGHLVENIYDKAVKLGTKLTASLIKPKTSLKEQNTNITNIISDKGKAI